MVASRIFITGANRGIGLEMVRQLVRYNSPKPEVIIAACRDPDKAKELQALAEENKSVRIVKLEVTDYPSLQSIVSQVSDIVGDFGLNLLINNAGIALKNGGLQDVTPEDIRTTMEINTIAPLIVSRAFLPLLQKAAKKNTSAPLGCQRAAIVNVTSKMGSLTDNGSGGSYAYRSSKIALNMITKSLSVDLAGDDIFVTAIHPGWVQTDMGGPKAPTKQEDSVRSMLGALAQLGPSQAGLPLNHDGQLLPL